MPGYLFDSNILIYSASPDIAYDTLRDLLILPDGAVSAISQVEVLGFPRLTTPDRFYLEAMFEALEIIPVTNQVILLAISLAKRHNLKAVDAIIAASSITTQRTLVTSDHHFKNVADLQVWFQPISS